MADTVKCPWCAEEILAEARKCKHCGEFLTDERPSRTGVPVEGGTDEVAEPPRSQPQPPRRSEAQSHPVWRFGPSGWTCIKHGQANCISCRLIIAVPKQPGERGDQYPVVVDEQPPRQLPQPTRSSEVDAAGPVWRSGPWGWTCIKHGKAACVTCRSIIPPPKQAPKRGEQYPVHYVNYSGAPGSRRRLSEAGNQSQAGLACPRCGGTQFVAKRSAKGKAIGFATLGVGGLIAPKSRVKCVACGMMFLRG